MLSKIGAAVDLIPCPTLMLSLGFFRSEDSIAASTGWPPQMMKTNAASLEIEWA
jgi:hypothetical protein